MKVWFDADNGPHVLIIRPLVEELARRGHEVVITARDRANTCELLDMYGIPYRRIGGEYARGKAGKVVGTLRRAAALLRTMAGDRPNVSFGHGSRALPIASWFLRVPSVTMYDYEWVDPALFNRFCRRILLPAVIDRERCVDAGIAVERVRFYDGLKEELYLASHRRDPSELSDLGLREDTVRILLRPPATHAHYHNPEAETLLVALLEILAEHPEVQLIYLPRTPDQLDLIPADFRGEVIVPQRVYDGPTLIAAMDAVFSGGGTMTREAAVLGVPAYSFFRGKSGRVDEWLVEQGRLVMLTDPGELRERVVVARRGNRDGGTPAGELVGQICDLILDVAG